MNVMPAVSKDRTNLTNPTAVSAVRNNSHFNPMSYTVE